MASPSLQSNSQTSGGGTAVTPSLPSNTAGNLLVVGTFGTSSFVSSVVDSAGNTYVPGPSAATPGGRFIQLYYCLSCFASAITNTIIATWVGTQGIEAVFVEYGPVSGVAISQSLNSSGSSAPSITLTGSISNDIVTALFLGDGTAISAGNVGTNTGNDIARGGFSDGLFQDGLSSGGSINVTATPTTGSWGIVVLEFSQPGPTINTQPSDQIVLPGSTATFTVAATASAGSLTYQWKLNGTNVSTGSGGTTASYTTGTLSFSDTGGIYTCVVTDSNGSLTSNSASLTVLFATKLFWIKA